MENLVEWGLPLVIVVGFIWLVYYKLSTRKSGGLAGTSSRGRATKDRSK